MLSEDYVNVISNMQIKNYNQFMILATGSHAKFFIGGDNLAPNILVTIFSHHLYWRGSNVTGTNAQYSINLFLLITLL